MPDPIDSEDTEIISEYRNIKDEDLAEFYRDSHNRLDYVAMDAHHLIDKSNERYDEFTVPDGNESSRNRLIYAEEKKEKGM